MRVTVRPWSERRATVYLVLGWVLVIAVVLGLVLLGVWVTDHNFFDDSQ